MDKIYYTAIIEQADTGFGVFFPDLPGCVTAADTLTEAIANAEAVLSLHLNGMGQDAVAFPKPRLPTQIEADPEVEEVARVMIGALPETEKIRVNVIIERNLLNAIDAVARNRSSFLAEAARARLGLVTAAKD